MPENNVIVKEFKNIMIDSFGFIGGYIVDKQMKDLKLQNGQFESQDIVALIDRLHVVAEEFCGQTVADKVKKKLRKGASDHMNIRTFSAG